MNFSEIYPDGPELQNLAFNVEPLTGKSHQLVKLIPQLAALAAGGAVV